MRETTQTQSLGRQRNGAGPAQAQVRHGLSVCVCK
jgi:hypothetical protein